MGPHVLKTIDEFRSYRRSLHPDARVGFVPTMGALHAGHSTLLEKIRPRCDVSILSIYVNPTQFGPQEDYGKYPRTLETDLEIAARNGVDAVFLPSNEMMYPPGFSTFVEEQSISRHLCGAVRRWGSEGSHFRGVTTVVLKLFNIVQPHLAYFGLKDAQQFFILHRMVQDLNLDVSVEAVATVREPDGLALSSRNVYLEPGEREKAPLFYQTLKKIAAASDNLADALASGRSFLESKGFTVQYLEARRLPDFSNALEIRRQNSEAVLLAGAVYLGKTRLIDNIILNPGNLPAGIKVHL